MKATLGLVFALVLAGSAMGDEIDFSTGGVKDNGTLSYAGGATSLDGTNIAIGIVTGNGTASNSGVTDPITGGLLNFTTGVSASYSAGTYTWSGPGIIGITGVGPGCTTIGGCGGNTPNTLSGPLLLSGSIDLATYTGGVFKVALVAGSDTKDGNLTRFFGYNPATVTFTFSGSIHTKTAPAPGGGAFILASGGSTDVLNTVPDGSSTLLLLGLASAGIGLAVRRLA